MQEVYTVNKIKLSKMVDFLFTSWSPGGAGNCWGEVQRLLHLRAVRDPPWAATKLLRVQRTPAVGPVELPEHIYNYVSTQSMKGLYTIQYCAVPRTYS